MRAHHHILLLRQGEDAPGGFQAGVSLHGHTRHSQESLGFIGKFLQQNRPLHAWIEKQRACCRRTTGIHLDFDRAYWTPPVCERQAHQLEAAQIAALGLRPLVSLTDHNSIEAPVLLRQQPEFYHAPVSTEWTIPFGQAVFHLGVHNLPAAGAQEILGAFHQATYIADERKTLGLLAELSAMPGVLLVFNHPAWNFSGISTSQYNFELQRFLQSAHGYLHACELNGMRSHQENLQVLRLAAEWNQPVVSGGDRHGCEPNAAINLTRAADFPAFVDEIRSERRSTVLLMPQYSEPLNWRFYKTFTDVVREYPGSPKRQRWDERTFHPNLEGEMVPMRELWQQGAPRFLERIFALALLTANCPGPGLRRLLIPRSAKHLLQSSGCTPRVKDAAETPCSLLHEIS